MHGVVATHIVCPVCPPRLHITTPSPQQTQTSRGAKVAPASVVKIIGGHSNEENQEEC